MKLFFKKPFFLMIFTALLVLFSCGVVKDCDQIGLAFYNCLKTKDFSYVTTFLDKEALSHTPENVWIDGLRKKDIDLGNVLSVKRIDFETVTKDRVTRVGIKYKVVYSGAVMFEKLEFIQRGSEYKITYYQFNADSLLVY